MKSIVLIVPYIGKWPFWFDAHLMSIAQNPSVNWLFITDCEIPEDFPENVRFVPATLESLNTRINSGLGLDVPLSPRKICDVRPAYGEIFQEYISDYDFWGFCDLDIIWGNIRSFVTDDDLKKYDIISSRKNNTSGHFTIFKNNVKINSLYESIPEFRKKLGMVKLQRMDEDVLTEYLLDRLNNTSENDLKIKWDRILCNQERGRDSHQEYHLDKWLWKEGKMLELKDGEPINEVMYLHFINWKRTMKFSEVEYSDQPKQFYISYNGIQYRTHSSFAKIMNGIKNMFVGYEVRMHRKKLFKKLKSKF